MNLLDRLLSRLWARWRPQAGTEGLGVSKVVRRYGRGVCPRCGRADLALRADGQPHRRHHCAADLPLLEPDAVPEVDPRRDPLVGHIGEVTP